jgi:lipid II:glycine glycyltransferase (peptidoglycan interpeptide bridge formation enzyme)
MSLKVQPYLPGKEYIQSLKPLFYKLGFKADFTDTPEQTRFVDLRPSTEDILKGFASRARAKFIIKNPDEVDICKIQNNLAIPGMQEALDHAFLRSINKKCPFRFEPFLKLFNKNSKIISIFGFYFKDDLINPKAFVTGINHGPIIEYSTGGSLSDQRLRKFQFNNILFWKLIEEAKKNECDFFDLGGISSGASDDPTAGVAQFKRHYPGFELAVGFGVQKTIRPLKYKIFQLIKYCVSRLGYT